MLLLKTIHHSWRLFWVIETVGLSFVFAFISMRYAPHLASREFTSDLSSSMNFASDVDKAPLPGDVVTFTLLPMATTTASFGLRFLTNAISNTGTPGRASMSVRERLLELGCSDCGSPWAVGCCATIILFVSLVASLYFLYSSIFVMMAFGVVVSITGMSALTIRALSCRHRDRHGRVSRWPHVCFGCGIGWIMTWLVLFAYNSWGSSYGLIGTIFVFGLIVLTLADPSFLGQWKCGTSRFAVLFRIFDHTGITFWAVVNCMVSMTLLAIPVIKKLIENIVG